MTHQRNPTSSPSRFIGLSIYELLLLGFVGAMIFELFDTHALKSVIEAFDTGVWMPSAGWWVRALVTLIFVCSWIYTRRFRHQGSPMKDFQKWTLWGVDLLSVPGYLVAYRFAEDADHPLLPIAGILWVGVLYAIAQWTVRDVSGRHARLTMVLSVIGVIVMALALAWRLVVSSKPWITVASLAVVAFLTVLNLAELELRVEPWRSTVMNRPGDAHYADDSADGN